MRQICAAACAPFGLGFPPNAVRSSAHALLRRTLSPTQTKGASPMALTVFNKFPQLTRLLARIARVEYLPRPKAELP